MEFMAQFPDDDACLEHLWRTRHSADGQHAVCARCKVERTFRRYENAKRRQSWTCTTCGLHVHPTAGTIFHKSSTSLHLWFYALFLITSTRCGISAKQLERELGVTYKTAWRMFNVIRNSLMAEPDITPLPGTVEADETTGASPTSTRTRGATTIASTPSVAPASAASRRGRRSSGYCRPGLAVRAERGLRYRAGGAGALSSLSRLASNSPRVGTGIFSPLGVYCSIGCSLGTGRG
jgi:transposase-like protein